jgi:alkylhydroperoxidase/carboxymuconolactone decarboxylase family protein YurZ
MVLVCEAGFAIAKQRPACKGLLPGLAISRAARLNGSRAAKDHHNRGRSGENTMANDVVADAHFEHIWKVYEEFLMGRRILSERLRQLAVIGQCSTMGEEVEAEEQIRKALASGEATPQEILEVILQTRVYVGAPRMKRTLRRFFRVCEERGLRREDVVSDVGAEGWDSERDLEAERPRWLPGKAEFPEQDRLIEKYGWKGMSVGMMMQPANFPGVMIKCDGLDPDFAQAWIDVVHEGMYSRPILSQRDRTLIMIADTISVMELTQATHHMTNAIRLGIPPRQVLEICFHSTVHAGMPKLTSAGIFSDLCIKHGVSPTDG